MADWPNSIMAVVDRVKALDPNRTLEEVIGRLLEIEREKGGFGRPDRRPVGQRVLRMVKPPDGVACFNFMYLRVTQAVHRNLGSFEEPEAVQRLAVVFAEFYFMAYGAAGDHAPWVSKAWEPLFLEKDNRRVLPLQFALAGLSAHINNDLAWALLQVWDEGNGPPADRSPQHADFLQVNNLLAAVQADVRATLERGFLKWLDRLLGRSDDVVAEIVLKKARDEAWERARRWHGSVDPARAAAHDREVGYQSHLILGA